MQVRRSDMWRIGGVVLCSACAHLPIRPEKYAPRCGNPATIRVVQAATANAILHPAPSGFLVVRVIAPTWNRGPATRTNVYIRDRGITTRYRSDTNGVLVYRRVANGTVEVQVGKLRYWAEHARVPLRVGFRDTLEFTLGEAWLCTNIKVS